MVPTVFERRQAYYSGNVQGVGFRFTTRRIAQEFDVTGFVRNLPDRRVEVVAEGPPDDLDDFMAAVGERMSNQIRNVDCDRRPAIDEFSSFDIRY